MNLMPSKKKIKNLLKKIEIIDNSVDKFKKFNDILNKKKVKILTFLNHHAVNIAYNDNKFYNVLIHSDLTYRDGIGIKIACILNEIKSGQNMNGTDFIPLILERYKHKKIAIFGGTSETIKNFYKLYSFKYKIISHMDGYKISTLYIKELNRLKPDILLLGMGMPNQEYLSKKIKDVYKENLVVINGGAILDFMTGKIKRSPKMLSKIGLEWLYRLYLEPSRLFRRYVIGIPLYLYRIFRELILGE